MTQFTKFTNLPIYSDPQRTAITNTLISDIPVGDVRDDKLELLSYREASYSPQNDLFFLFTKRLLPNNKEINIFEESCSAGKSWWVQMKDNTKKTYSVETSDGNWDQYATVSINGVDKSALVCSFAPHTGVKIYTYPDSHMPATLYKLDQSSRCGLDITYFVRHYARTLAANGKDLSLLIAPGKTEVIGNPNELASYINMLIDKLSLVRDALVPV